MRMACQHHAECRFCPLYHAAHDPALSAWGCDDGRVDEGGCAVDRGMDYAEAVGRIAALAPRVVAELRWKEDAAASAAQRARNMRLLRIN
jgi:hypothetical protein